MPCRRPPASWRLRWPAVVGASPCSRPGHAGAPHPRAGPAASRRGPSRRPSPGARSPPGRRRPPRASLHRAAWLRHRPRPRRRRGLERELRHLRTQAREPPIRARRQAGLGRGDVGLGGLDVEERLVVLLGQLFGVTLEPIDPLSELVGLPLLVLNAVRRNGAERQADSADDQSPRRQGPPRDDRSWRASAAEPSVAVH